LVLNLIYTFKSISITFEKPLQNDLSTREKLIFSAIKKCEIGFKNGKEKAKRKRRSVCLAFR